MIYCRLYADVRIPGARHDRLMRAHSRRPTTREPYGDGAERTRAGPPTTRRLDADEYRGVADTERDG